MQIGQWQFKPRLIPSITTILVLPLLVALGFWQLDRADQKRTIYQGFLKHQEEVPVNLNDVNVLKESKSELMWRHVFLSGSFVSGIVILLDNQTLDGVPGYLVFSPFRLTGKDKVVLVNRGWIVGNGNREEIPAIDTPTSDIKIEGLVKDVPATGIFLGNAPIETMSNGIYRAQRIEIDEIEQVLQLNLLPYIVRLEPDSGYGFERKWQLPGSGEEKHLGYAFQWFVLAITLVIIYVAVNTKKNDGGKSE